MNMENKNNKKNLSGIKLLIVSAALSAAVWLWSIFSNQAVQNLTTTASQQSNTGLQPVATQSSTSSTAASASIQPTLRSVAVDTSTSSSQVVVQPVVDNSSSAITSTGSSRP
jgi:cytoskeletal protein RodZ